MAETGLIAPNGMTELNRAVLELPGWIARGLAFRLVGLLSLLLLLSLALPWNETLQVPLTIVTISPPSGVRATQAGTLVRLTVSSDQLVSQGQVLAQFGTSEEIAEADRLESSAEATLAALRRGEIPEDLPSITLGGEVQTAYAELASAVGDLAASVHFETDRVDVEALRRSLVELERQSGGLAENIALTDTLAAVSEARLVRKEAGAAKGWISKDSLEKAREEMLERRRAAHEAREKTDEHRAQIADLRLRLEGTQLRQARSSTLKRERAVQATVDALAAVRRWRADHFAVAPVAGRVKFPEEIFAGQHLDKGAELAVIVPRHSDLKAVGIVPAQARGEVVPGSDVRLSFASFPVSNYGYVAGKVERTSDVAVRGDYQVTVSLPGGLVTSTGYRIPVRNRGMATGRITVHQGRIATAVFGGFYEQLGLR